MNIIGSCLTERFAASTISHTGFGRKPIGGQAGRATWPRFSDARLGSRLRFAADVTCSGQLTSYGLAGHGDSTPSFLLRFSSSDGSQLLAEIENAT